MNKRKFLAMLLSVIMVAALAVPTLTAFAETQTPSNPKTITVEIFNNNPDEVVLSSATAIEENGVSVISISNAWSGHIKLQAATDMTKAQNGYLCFEYKIISGESEWGNLSCKLSVSYDAGGWDNVEQIEYPGLKKVDDYTVRRLDLSSSKVLASFKGFAVATGGTIYVKRVWIEYPNPDYVEDTTVDITFYDGNKTKIENLSTVYSTVDGVLPDYTADGKVFIGWQTADGKLYAAGAAVTAETPAEFYAAAIEFATQDGAYIRVGENAAVSGIRFDTTFNAAEYTAIKNFVTEYGTLILPKDFLTEGKDFTLENFEVDKTILKIKSTVSTTGEDGVTTYRGAIFEINEANYNRCFAARGYFTVKYTNGETKNFYSAAYANNSVANVAKVFKESADYENLSDEQKSIVDAYAAKYQA